MWNLKPKELQLLGDHFALELNQNPNSNPNNFNLQVTTFHWKRATIWLPGWRQTSPPSLTSPTHR